MYKVLVDSYIVKKVKMLVSQLVQLYAPQWTLPRQAPLSMELSRQEYWSG